MKNLIITICFLLSCSLYSQNDLQTVFPVNDEKTNFVKYEFLLADQVALRSKPSLSGEILSRLEIGSRLFLIERSDEMMVQNGIKSHWYKVVVNEKTGWVWGGLIAMQSFDSSTDASLKFVAGYEKSRYNAERERYDCQYQVRAISEHRQLDKIVFNATDGVDSGENLGKKGLENLEDILKFKTICGDYDCLMETVYLFWSDQKFHKVFKLFETIDEGQEGIHNNETLSFPSDSDGISGMITQISKELEFIGDNEETEIYLNTTKDFFKWDGTKILPANKKAVSTKIKIKEIQGNYVLSSLNLEFDKISEQEFLEFKNNYDNKIVLDASKVERPGFPFSLEIGNKIEEFPCPKDYIGCYYYGGYLTPLEIYLIQVGHRGYTESFAIHRKNGEQFPFYSPFDAAASSVLISKEEDQLMTFAVTAFDRVSFIGHYKIEQEGEDVYFSELKEFQTDEWKINELVWMDKNTFALKVYDQEVWSNEANKTVLKAVKYLKAKIVE